MRRLQSPQEIEKKKKRNMLLLSVFLLVVLVFGTIGYGLISGLGDSDNTDGNVGEGTLTNVGNKWAMNFQGQTFYFSNHLDSTTNTTLNISRNLNDYFNVPLYISSENSAIINEISSTLGSYTRIQEACYLSCPEKDLPEKNCTDNIIVWQDSIENRVYQKDNCIFIDGDLRTVDAFLYHLFGIN